MLRPLTGAAVAIAAVTVLVAVRRRYLVVTVDGASMQPTFFDGDRLLVRTGAAQTPRRGEVVVLWTPFEPGRDAPSPDAGPARNGRSVKRVVAVPGDPLPPAAAEACGRPAGTAVPPGRLVVFGDARHSYDSRSWGFLPVERLVGVVVRRLSAHRGR